MAFFAARQPILNKHKDIQGYELLFRTSSDNVFPDVDQEKATSKMIEGLQLDLGLDKISSGKPAFINFTEQSILQDYPTLLPKEKIVVEVLEDVNPTKEIYNALKNLADNGYTIAFDDFIHDAKWEPFYQLCNIIKIDCQHISDEELKQISEVKARFPHITLLAEKVENYEEFNKFCDLGFDLFQGYFFSRPTVIKSVSLNSSQSLLSSLLNEVSKPEIDFAVITRLIEVDVALSFKLLRYTESPLFSRSKKIESIRQAVILLGKAELERFVMLMFAATFGEGKPNELIRLSLHRAKFCELMANKAKLQSHMSSAFLVGMLSLIDAMLDAEINELVTQMPLTDPIKEALLKNQGWLADMLSLCKHIEKADWLNVENKSKKVNTECPLLFDLYQQAGAWSEAQMQFIKS